MPKKETINRAETPNTYQVIALICRQQNLPFNLGQLDDLVKLCEAFNRIQSAIK